MSHFYGIIKGDRGKVSRRGSRNSGMETYCASWKGAVRCFAFSKDGKDWVRVEKVTWLGEGEYELLYEGPIGSKEVKE